MIPAADWRPARVDQVWRVGYGPAAEQAMGVNHPSVGP